jgi:hypothetical protein
MTCEGAAIAFMAWIVIMIAFVVLTDYWRD